MVKLKNSPMLNAEIFSMDYQIEPNSRTLRCKPETPMQKYIQQYWQNQRELDIKNGAKPTSI